MMTPIEQSLIIYEIEPLMAHLIDQFAHGPRMRSELRDTLRAHLESLLEEYDPAVATDLYAHLTREVCKAAYYCSQRSKPIARRGAPTAVAPEQIRVEIDRLPDPARQMMIWRFYEGLSFEEIGERIKVDHETMNRFMEQALDLLGRCMNLAQPERRETANPGPLPHRNLTRGR